ncbi:hypothetical protein PP707_07555, partial [Acetobacter pasteurianus]|nr:hypothetical protein [Acetobacter pasteurianus]
RREEMNLSNTCINLKELIKVVKWNDDLTWAEIGRNQKAMLHLTTDQEPLKQLNNKHRHTNKTKQRKAE